MGTETSKAPMTVIARTEPPEAARAASRLAGIKSDEHTAKRRRVIDRGIAKGPNDIRNGRIHGPFETADTAIAHLQSLSRSRKRGAKST